MSDGEDRWEFEVYFPKEKEWFKGRVLEEEPTENGTESWVVFEDGGKFWLLIGALWAREAIGQGSWSM